MNNWNKSLVCKLATPALGCNYFEMLILSILFFIISISCLFYIYLYFNSKMYSKSKIINFHMIFWIFLFIWSIYCGIIHLVPFNYSLNSYYIWFVNVNNVGFFFSLSFVIFIIFEHYFQYRNPGPGADWFFRIFLFTFLGVFLYLGIILSYTNDSNKADDYSLMFLWQSCISFLFSIFILVPSLSLISAVSYPVIQPEDLSCIQISKIIVWLSTIIFLIRSIYNFLNFLKINPILKWFFNNDKDFIDKLSNSKRIYGFFFSFIFTFLPALLSLIGVHVIFQHDIDFLDDSFYAAAKSDTESYVK